MIQNSETLAESIEAERALFESQVDALVASVYENERPLAGLAGILDWRFHGVISSALRSGAITGKPGECVYVPAQKNGKLFRLILAGAGKSQAPGERVLLPVESLRVLQKNLVGLGLSRIGISRRDFGGASDDFFSKNLQKVPIRITL
jgi:hypothetical protein